ncbi:MAG: DUF4097 family beta strand repeat protein [Flavobacteriales bacterium]|nr:DUF4097 family beta strand repeat protein [Flavobacteriales bacterium]
MKRVFAIMVMVLLLPVSLMSQVRVNNITIGRDGYIEQYGWKIKIKNSNNVWINGHKIDGKVDVIVYNRDKIKVNGRDVTSQVSIRNTNPKNVSNVVINGRNLDDVLERVLTSADVSPKKGDWYEISDKVIASSREKGIDAILCDQTALSVQVSPTDEDEVSVEAHVRYMKVSNPDYGIEIKRYGSRLEIKQKGGAMSFNTGNKIAGGGIIKIKVPRTMMQYIVINNISGATSMHGVEAGYINCTTISGAVALARVKAEKSITLTSTSGGLAVDSAECGGMVVLSSISGSIFVRDVKCNKINANATSGGVRIVDSGAELVVARSISGAVNVSVTEGSLKDMSVKTTSGSIRLSLPGNIEKDYTYNMSGVSGTIRIGSITASKQLSMRNDDARANVQCSSVSGSITVIQGTSGIVK